MNALYLAVSPVGRASHSIMLYLSRTFAGCKERKRENEVGRVGRERERMSEFPIAAEIGTRACTVPSQWSRRSTMKFKDSRYSLV